MRYCLLAVLFLASPASVRAEDLLTVDFRRLPFMHLKDPKNSFQDAVKVRPARIHLNGGVPVKIGWTELFLGGDWEVLPFTYADWDFTQQSFRVDSLQALALDLRLRQKFSESAAVRVFAKPGLYSDFAKVTSKSSRLQGGFAVEKTILGGLTLGLGAEATNVYGTRKVLPVMTLGYQSRYFRASGHFPEKVELYFVPTGNLEVGVKGSVTGGNYRLEESGTFKGSDIRYSVGTLGPSVNWRLGRFLTWTLDAGTTFLHSFSTYNSGTNVRDFDLKHALFLMTGVKLHLGG